MNNNDVEKVRIDSKAAGPSSSPGKSMTAPLAVYVKLVLAALCWGGTFSAGRVITHALPNLYMIPAAGRYAVACLLLLPVAYKLEGGLPRLNAQQMLATFALGATGIFLYNLCFFAALAYIPGGRASLFVALNPAVIALALALFFRERLSKLQWCGIAIAFAGAAVIITRGDLRGALHDLSQSLGAGELLMFCATSGWAAYTIIGRHALKGLSPIAATTYASLWGLLLLGCGAALEWHALDLTRLTWPVIASIVYMGAFGTVIAFIWYYEGINAIGPTRTSVFNNLVPVFGISLGAVLLHEPILMSMVLGGTLVIAGVSLTNR